MRRLINILVALVLMTSAVACKKSGFTDVDTIKIAKTNIVIDANGTIENPLYVDSQGRFEWARVIMDGENAFVGTSSADRFIWLNDELSIDYSNRIGVKFEWVEVEYLTIEGRRGMKFSIPKNTSSEQRKCRLIISALDGPGSKFVDVTQKGCPKEID